MQTSSSSTNHGPPKLPSSFGPPRRVRALNVAATGLALAATAGGLLGLLRDHEQVPTNSFGAHGITVASPTLLFGVLWALVWRLPAKPGKTRHLRGWLASIPLAMLNCALGCGIMAVASKWDHDGSIARFAIGALVGATLGAFFWIPSLLVALLFVGVPLAWAQRLADKGLAGEERGERFLGITSAVFASGGLAMAIFGTHLTFGTFGHVGLALLYLFASAGIVAGASATLMTRRRAAQRRRFLDEVASGKVEGYRIDERRALVRVTEAGENYRAASIEEEIDEPGYEARAEKLQRVDGPS